MANYSKANVNLEAGIIELATDWDGTTYDDGTGANETTILSALEAFSYVNIGWFTDLSFFHAQEDEREINTDACGAGTIDRSVETTPRMEFTWQEVDNLDRFADFLGLNVQDVAGVLVAGATQVLASGGWAYNGPVKVANQNGDGSLLTINSVTGGTDGLLVANTDYFVGQNSNGETTITIIDSATVTTLSQTMTIDYDYTPNASQQLTYKVQARSVPFNTFRVTECNNEQGEANVYYLVKASVTSEIQQQLVNRKTTDFVGAAMVMTGQSGGNWFEKKERVTDF